MKSTRHLGMLLLCSVLGFGSIVPLVRPEPPPAAPFGYQLKINYDVAGKRPWLNPVRSLLRI